MSVIARKFLCIFLSIALVVTFCPLAAYADPADGEASAVEAPDSSLAQAAEEPAADEAVADEPAKNGAKAGSSGFGKELQAYEVVVVKKGAAAPGSTSNAYKQAMVQSNTHMQSYGWVGWAGDGFTSGVVGESKRMEAIQIRLNKAPTSGGIRYKTHVQKYGWRDWSYDGGKNGSTGESKRLEAIQIELTGNMAKQYDIYYRVHAQTFGWMGWAKNGEKAGTAGYANRLEAFR